MKKSVVSLPIVGLCLTLSLTAFALPIYAEVNMQTAEGKVLVRETPKEYMQDFSIEGKQAKGQSINTIFLSESQISSFKSKAEKAFKDTLGIEIPAKMSFKYNTMSTGGVQIGLTWSDDKGLSASKDGVLYFADFFMEDISKPAVLRGIGAKNGYTLKKLDGLRSQAIEALKKQVGAAVPDNCFLATKVIVNYVEEKHDINVQFEWSKGTISDLPNDTFAYSYGVSFDKVDLSKNIGRVTVLENMEATFGGVNNNAPKFTNVQEKNMLEGAKKFLAGKEIGFGNLISSRQIGNIMWFTFDSTAENNSARSVVEVYIGLDLKVTGYLF